MKVLFIHCRYKQAGGEDGVVTAEVELLKSKGIDVELLSFSNEGSTVLKLLQLPFNIGSYFRTKRFLKSFKPDVVHIHNVHFAASPSVLYAIKSQGIPIALTLHNFRLLCPSGTLFHDGKIYLKSLHSQFPWEAIKDGVYNHSKLLTFWLGFSTWFNRKIGTWDLFDRYIFLTGHARSIFEKSSMPLDPKKIVIKPNFVPDPGPGTEARNKNFLFVGRLSEEKGIHVLLEAFKNSRHTIKIIGGGPMKDKVEAAAKDHPNIVYLGFQQKNFITNELKKCTALIFSSVWYENLPLTIIEAFSTATPVIASNIGAPSILIQNEYNGLHFKESDAQDLGRKLDEWDSLSEEERARYRKHARDTYELYYNPEKNFNQLMAIYQSMIGRA
jgi:glycosyltransferase involved in cell wall biosynthesis